MRDAANTTPSTIATSKAAIANSHAIMRQSQLKLANARENLLRRRGRQTGDEHSDGIEGLFLSVITASAPLVGRAYFEILPRIIADAWGSAAFITGIERNATCRLLGIAGVARRGQPPELTGQPWLGNSTSATISYASDAGRLFPDEPLLEGIETFLSVPLFDAVGTRIGYVGMLDTKKWSPAEAATAESLLRLVAPRASAEIERDLLQERHAFELRNFTELATQSGEGFLIWIAEKPPRLIYANQAATRILGLQEHEIASHPELLAAMLDAAEADEGTRTGVLTVPTDDGPEVAVEFRLTVDAEYADAPRYRCILRDAVGQRDHRDAEDAWLAGVLRELPFATAVICDDQVAFMNARASEVMGATGDDLLDHAVVLSDHGHPVSLTLREFARRALASGSSTSTTRLRLKLRRGRERSIEMRTNVITIAGKTRLILAPLDLTREQTRHDRLLTRAELSARILASLPLDIIVIDAEGHVVALSDPANRFAQQTREIARCRPALNIGDDYIAICREGADGDDEVARRALHGVGSVLSGAVPHFVIQYESVGEEGHHHAVLMSATPLDGGGAIITHSNITPLKQNERRLAKEEARQRELLRHLPDQLARVSADGRVLEVWMPDVASRMVAPLQRAPMSRSLGELLPEGAAERLARAVRDALHANTVVSCTVTVPFEDDEREYEMRVTPLPAHEVLVYVRDKTAEQWTAGASMAAEEPIQRQRMLRENPYGLTFREAAVLELMAQGASDKEIATSLGVSVFTIYKHVSKILHKMNAVSRTEASLRTVREHLFG